MYKALALIVVLVIGLIVCGTAWAQEAPVAADSPAARETVDEALDKVDDLAEQVNQSEQAQEVKAGILNPIYSLAERFSFPAFHWFAFALMVTGVVSFALQLVLGKLIVLTRLSLSPTEVLSDAMGLVVSLVGLVLTTQAATENSSFTASAFAVISSTAVGVLVGFVFYVWGQRQELLAVEGKRKGAVQQQGATTAPKS